MVSERASRPSKKNRKSFRGSFYVRLQHRSLPIGCCPVVYKESCNFLTKFNIWHQERHLKTSRKTSEHILRYFFTNTCSNWTTVVRLRALKCWGVSSRSRPPDESSEVECFASWGLALATRRRPNAWSLQDGLKNNKKNRKHESCYDKKLVPFSLLISFNGVFFFRGLVGLWTNIVKPKTLRSLLKNRLRRKHNPCTSAQRT